MLAGLQTVEMMKSQSIKLNSREFKNIQVNIKKKKPSQKLKWLESEIENELEFNKSIKADFTGFNFRETKFYKGSKQPTKEDRKTKMSKLFSYKYTESVSTKEEFPDKDSDYSAEALITSVKKSKSLEDIQAGLYPEHTTLAKGEDKAKHVLKKYEAEISEYVN